MASSCRNAVVCRQCGALGHRSPHCRRRQTPTHRESTPTLHASYHRPSAPAPRRDQTPHKPPRRSPSPQRGRSNSRFHNHEPHNQQQHQRSPSPQRIRERSRSSHRHRSLLRPAYTPRPSSLHPYQSRPPSPPPRHLSPDPHALSGDFLPPIQPYAVAAFIPPSPELIETYHRCRKQIVIVTSGSTPSTEDVAAAFHSLWPEFRWDWAPSKLFDGQFVMETPSTFHFSDLRFKGPFQFPNFSFSIRQWAASIGAFTRQLNVRVWIKLSRLPHHGTFDSALSLMVQSFGVFIRKSETVKRNGKKSTAAVLIDVANVASIPKRIDMVIGHHIYPVKVKFLEEVRSLLPNPPPLSHPPADQNDRPRHQPPPNSNNESFDRSTPPHGTGTSTGHQQPHCGISSPHRRYTAKEKGKGPRTVNSPTAPSNQHHTNASMPPPASVQIPITPLQSQSITVQTHPATTSPPTALLPPAPPQQPSLTQNLTLDHEPLMDAERSDERHIISHPQTISATTLLHCTQWQPLTILRQFQISSNQMLPRVHDIPLAPNTCRSVGIHLTPLISPSSGLRTQPLPSRQLSFNPDWAGLSLIRGPHLRPSAFDFSSLEIQPFTPIRPASVISNSTSLLLGPNKLLGPLSRSLNEACASNPLPISSPSSLTPHPNSSPIFLTDPKPNSELQDVDSFISSHWSSSFLTPSPLNAVNLTDPWSSPPIQGHSMSSTPPPELTPPPPLPLTASTTALKTMLTVTPTQPQFPNAQPSSANPLTYPQPQPTNATPHPTQPPAAPRLVFSDDLDPMHASLTSAIDSQVSDSSFISNTAMPHPNNTIRRSARLLQSARPSSSAARAEERAKVKALEIPASASASRIAQDASLLGSIQAPIRLQDFTDSELMIISTACGYKLEATDGPIFELMRSLETERSHNAV